MSKLHDFLTHAERTEIWIATHIGAATVRAYVTASGEWALHPSKNTGFLWAITHTRTGCAFSRTLRLDRAIRLILDLEETDLATRLSATDIAANAALRVEYPDIFPALL